MLAQSICRPLISRYVSLLPEKDLATKSDHSPIPHIHDIMSIEGGVIFSELARAPDTGGRNGRVENRNNNFI